MLVSLYGFDMSDWNFHASNWETAHYQMVLKNNKQLHEWRAEILLLLLLHIPVLVVVVPPLSSHRMLIGPDSNRLKTFLEKRFSRSAGFETWNLCTSVPLQSYSFSNFLSNNNILYLFKYNWFWLQGVFYKSNILFMCCLSNNPGCMRNCC